MLNCSDFFKKKKKVPWQSLENIYIYISQKTQIHNIGIFLQLQKTPAIEGHMVNLRLWGWGGLRERAWCFEGCVDNIYDIGIDITCQGSDMG